MIWPAGLEHGVNSKVERVGASGRVCPVMEHPAHRRSLMRGPQIAGVTHGGLREEETVRVCARDRAGSYPHRPIFHGEYTDSPFFRYAGELLYRNT
jgi:hypothetical protein